MSQTSNQPVFEKYVQELREAYLHGDATEYSGRGALETLLKSFAHGQGSTVRHEPKQVSAKGAPDFKIMKDGAILGYVENKAPATPLDPVLKSDQVKRYRTLSDNILVTDYLHFAWINADGIQRETLCYETDLENPKFAPKEDRVAAVSALLDGFFSVAPEGISRAPALALALATRSRLLRDFLGEELVRQEREHTEGRLYGLFQVFRDQVFHNLSLAEFADAFAQNLAYGLFLARLNSEGETISLHNAQRYIPGSFRLIRELVDFLDVLEEPTYRDIRWVVEEVLSIVNGLNLPAIHEDLAFRNRPARYRQIRAKDEEEWRLFSRDPFVYFYEDYLAKYDATMRKRRGVYYTPPPVVNFIIRAVDDILKDTFEIVDGLGDRNRVTVLDFACGTGTFLIEVLERIFENIGGPQSGKADLMVREHILKNIYGFEFLIAPYTVAHLKLSQFLRDQGQGLRADERFPVYLTNTLEPIEPQHNYLLPALTAETEAAQDVKDKPILVITGNPPYSGHSKNKGEWITKAIKEYKYVWETDEQGREIRKPLGERNPKWLQDDYVKFIRFAQMKMEAIDEGIVGIISNHSFLDNPTFRGMRQSLMRTFDQIYVLDLHGNANKREHAPDGSKDENVFDIEQGVAISLFVKKPGTERGVWHAELWGRRLEKYQTAMQATKSSIDWEVLDPVSPFYFFVPENREFWAEYIQGWQLTSIFPVSSVGVATARDKLSIHFTKSTLEQTLRRFVSLKPEIARDEFDLGKDVQDWKVTWAQEDIKENGIKDSLFQRILYRPFDIRYTYYTGRSRGFLCRPRSDVMRNLLYEKNIGLISSRMTKGEDFAHVHVTDTINEVICMSSKTSNNGFVFPLYVYSETEALEDSANDLFDSKLVVEDQPWQENLSKDFRRWLYERYNHRFTPEDVFGYIVAILHSPTYRELYREFLRRDFPRIPFPKNREDFEALSALGWDLIQKHLMREVPDYGLAQYHGKGSHSVEKPRYVEGKEAVYINETQYFAPVPASVWEFHIGGYQVIDKYLKSRKGRNLNLDEIEQVGRIANILAFTIDQMEKIDAAYEKAFG